VRNSRENLNALRESAEDGVGKGQVKLLRHSIVERRSQQIGRIANFFSEGPNGAPPNGEGK